jgi:hypothetical protein
MISSSYFIALTSDRPINLGLGLFFAVNWSSIANETFSHTVFFWTIKNTVSSKSDKHDFGSFVEIKDKTIESKLGSESATSCWPGSILLCKNYCSATCNLPESLVALFSFTTSFLRQNGEFFCR